MVCEERATPDARHNDQPVGGALRYDWPRVFRSEEIGRGAELFARQHAHPPGAEAIEQILTWERSAAGTRRNEPDTRGGIGLCQCAALIAASVELELRGAQHK